MPDLKTVLAEARKNVEQGKAFEQRIADGGYSLRVQRTTRWNQRHQHVIVHVWHRANPGEKSRLLRKEEWQALIA
jgi:hypothetical protein